MYYSRVKRYIVSLSTKEQIYLVIFTIFIGLNVFLCYQLFFAIDLLSMVNTEFDTSLEDYKKSEEELSNSEKLKKQKEEELKVKNAMLLDKKKKEQGYVAWFFKLIFGW